MRKFFLMGALLLSALTTQLTFCHSDPERSEGEESQKLSIAGVEITGFVDVLGQGEQGSWSTSFGMGAFEIDFASEFSERVCFEGAIVVEGEEVGLGQTLVDIGLIPDEKLGLQAGLLDMPFGLDYQVFATPDRKLVSPPLVTDIMMDGGWGDVGVNLHGAFPYVDYNLYVVNGMGEDGGAPVNQLTDNNGLKTIGGRLNIVPVEAKRKSPLNQVQGIGVEYVGFGISYAQGPYDEDEKLTWQRAGGHTQLSYGPVEAKGEFLYAKDEVSETSANEHTGYYLQILGKATEKIYGVARYGGWKPKGGETITRITTGVGYELIENVSLRIEYQMNTEEPKINNDLLSSQVVISF